MEINLTIDDLENIIDFAQDNVAVADALNKLVSVYTLAAANEPEAEVLITVKKNRFKSQAEEQAALQELMNVRYGL